jgi:hypothetical protein
MMSVAGAEGGAAHKGPGPADEARRLWESGLRVFPLHSFLLDTKTGAATCLCGWSGCIAPGKHPMASNWQHTPVWDSEQIDNMVSVGWYDSGYGVLCKGLLVIDVDARNGGLKSFAKLSALVPEIAGAGMIVETGSGGGSRHLYFKAPAGVALVQSLGAEYPGLDFKSSGYVVGPGSRHASGGAYRAVYGSPDDVDDAPAGLIRLLQRPERHRAEFDGRAVDVSEGDIVDMLAHVDPDCGYETWIRIGMAIHHATGGTGQAVWDRWSAKGEKYDSRRMDSHWHSFGRSSNPVTLGTLVHYAEEGGWKMPVSFVPANDFGDVPDVPVRKAPQKGAVGKDRRASSGLPFDTSGVDLTCPPGFVGDVAAWIENQSRRPRRKLAVAGALVAIGNVAGLRYTDDLDGVTCNLFAFCVAGSRTGKEAIQQAVAEVHAAAGCKAATHGAIKSEQEILRNLTRHQAAFYLIDEIGIFLQKIRNAQQKGGAAYLDGVIGMLMSAYSKADSFMLVSGDLKEDIRQALLKELSSLNRRLEEGDGRAGVDPAAAERHIRHLESALAGLDNGLEKPFLSLMGFTTPVTFDELVDYQSATNGFIGRSLIFQERDTAPRSKPEFRKAPMSPSMRAAISQIYYAGEYDMMADEPWRSGSRIEYYGPRTPVPTAPEASRMLADALEWFEDAAVAHKSRTGLEALYLGAYELVSKVSLILAVPEGRRTGEHVRWAFELVRQDIDSKARLVTANDSDKSVAKTALMAKIANIIEGEGETIGVIFNRLRKQKREDVQKTLDEMLERGLALKSEIEARKGQKPTVIFRLLT